MSATPEFATASKDTATAREDALPTPLRRALVTAAYRAILGRDPEQGGLEAYASHLHRPADLQTILARLVESDEFERNRLLASFAPPSTVADDDDRCHDPADVTFIQTSDPVRYRPMLDETQRTVAAYCARWNCKSQSHLGVIRGHHPWHAAFNRIFLLESLIASGRRGWVVYLDADAYVADFAFDVVDYLRDKADVAAIFAPSGATERWWDINDGIFLMNLGHPVARWLVHAWAAVMRSYPDALMRRADQHGVLMPGDQAMLQSVFRAWPAVRGWLHVESPDLINRPQARFLRQLLRVDAATFEERLAMIRTDVAQVLATLGTRTAPDVQRDDRP